MFLNFFEILMDGSLIGKARAILTNLTNSGYNKTNEI
jgi:hypothetical protein